MLKNLKPAAVAAALAVGAVTFTTSAEARDYYGRRGDDTAAIAVGAGIIGLAIGAVIASNNDRDYYRGGYYGGYSEGPAYYRGYPRGYYYDRFPRNYRYDRDHYRGWDRGHDRHWDRGRHRGW